MRQPLIGTALLAVGTLLIAADAHAGSVADDPDLRAVRQALAEPAASSAAVPTAPARRSRARHAAEHESRQVTIRYREATQEGADVTLSIDLDREDADAARWLEALAGSEVLSIEWDDGALDISVE